MLLCVGVRSPAVAADDILQKNDRVVFIGNTFADQLRLNGYVESLLTVRRPKLNLTFRVLGWSGDTLTVRPRPLNFGSLDTHLTRLQADVVVACFGMNESYAGGQGLAGFEKNWNQFLDHLKTRTYNGRTPPRVVLVAPIAHEALAEQYADAQTHNRKTTQYVAVMQKVAAQRNLPLLDLYAASNSLSAESGSQKLTRNGIHLNGYGYWALGKTMADALTPVEGVWKVSVDTQANSASGEGTRVSALKVEAARVAFTVTDERLPDPAPPLESIVHDSLARKLPALVVRGLPAGTYALAINGTRVASAQADAWAQGVRLQQTPAHALSEAIREDINAKNAQFFYRWRAHNAEYVFGRRAKPFGVVSFPPEMQKFDEMIDEKDKSIQRLNRPSKEQTWELVPLTE